jgi:tetratricopeptide (TPR) repeat protein
VPPVQTRLCAAQTEVTNSRPAPVTRGNCVVPNTPSIGMHPQSETTMPHTPTPLTHEALSFEDPAQGALRDAAAAVEAVTPRCQPLQMSAALMQLARCYADVKALTSAITCYQQALRWARVAGSCDHLVDLLCELSSSSVDLAQALNAQRPGSGYPALERARDCAFEASALASRVSDAGWEVKVLLRVSDIHDRCGDHDDAVLLQTRALRLMAGHFKGLPVDPSLLPSLGRLADC